MLSWGEGRSRRDGKIEKGSYRQEIQHVQKPRGKAEYGHAPSLLHILFSVSFLECS